MKLIRGRENNMTLASLVLCQIIGISFGSGEFSLREGMKDAHRFLDFALFQRPVKPVGGVQFREYGQAFCFDVTVVTSGPDSLLFLS